MTTFDLLSMLVLVGVLLVLVSGLCLCYAIWADAAARGASGFGWGLLAFLLFPIGAPVYAVYRTRLPDRDESADAVERRVGVVGVGGTTAVVVSALVSPPDPFTQAIYTIPLAVVFVPVAAVVCYDPGWRALVSRT